NALDAGATAVTVTLDRQSNGAHSIAVADNGAGIPLCDRPAMARRYCTSKLAAFADLPRVTTLGFRGEALHSLASLSRATDIVTRTRSDAVAVKYAVDHGGELTSASPTSGGVGTTVTVHELFHTLPVRRAILVKRKEALRPLLATYALTYPAVHWTLVDAAGRYALPSPPVSPVTLRAAVASVHGAAVADACMYLSLSAVSAADENDDPPAGCSAEIAVPSAAALASGSAPRLPPLFSLNRRPIAPPKTLLHALRAAFSRISPTTPSQVFAVAHLTLPADTFDVNVDPAKRAVLSESTDAIAAWLARALERAYGQSLAANAGRADSAVGSAPSPAPPPLSSQVVVGVAPRGPPPTVMAVPEGSCGAPVPVAPPRVLRRVGQPPPFRMPSAPVVSSSGGGGLTAIVGAELAGTESAPPPPQLLPVPGMGAPLARPIVAPTPPPPPPPTAPPAVRTPLHAPGPTPSHLATPTHTPRPNMARAPMPGTAHKPPQHRTIGVPLPSPRSPPMPANSNSRQRLTRRPGKQLTLEACLSGIPPPMPHSSSVSAMDLASVADKWRSALDRRKRRGPLSPKVEGRRVVASRLGTGGLGLRLVVVDGGRVVVEGTGVASGAVMEVPLYSVRERRAVRD
ncbi:hypothetical protein BC828DRAFT_393994, partial [Blastocladiella britannica]